MSTKTDLLIVGGVAIAVLGLAWYTKQSIGNAIDGAGNAIGGAFESVGQAVGGAVESGYNWLQGVNETARAPAVWAANAVGEVVPYVNPADSRNVVYSGVSSVGEYITGERGWTLGGQIYEWMN